MVACSNDISVFTDHLNLLLTFHATAVEPALDRHNILKVIRWDLHLSGFSYTFEHVPVELNTTADIMTRWMQGYLSKIRSVGQVARLHDSSRVNLVITVLPDTSG